MKNKEVFLGENIKKIRRKWRMNQEEMADFFGITRVAVGNYEKEKNIPNAFIIVELQNLTGINANDIIYTDLDENNIPSEPLSNKSGEQITETESSDTRLRELEERMAELEALVKKT